MLPQSIVNRFNSLVRCADYNGGARNKLEGCGCEFTNVTKYAFEPGPRGERTWERMQFHNCELTEVFRQSDSTFIDLLHRCRVNNMLPQDVALLRTCTQMINTNIDGVIPTKLCGVADLARACLPPGFLLFFKAPAACYRRCLASI